ncbi:MAG: glycoside hydrolase domain-containing protein [Terracidiphilus sp.]
MGGEKSMKWVLMEGKRLNAAVLLILLVVAGVMWTQKLVWAQTGLATGAAVEDMKLISPGSGWALAGHRLYWTPDNGQSWDDITPGDNQQHVSKAFFIDTKTGWAILPGNDGAGASITIASTRNGGRSWLNAQVALDSIAQGRRVGGVASVFFADSQQGWLILRLSSSSNFSIGAALHTEDGGSTWTSLPSPPAAGNIVFITSQDGWMAGGPAGGQLWFTRDSGRTWQSAVFVAPDGCAASRTSYSLPLFPNSSHGWMTATTENPDGNCRIDYSTEDGGQSWQLQRVSRDAAAMNAALANTGPQAGNIYASGSEIVIEQDGIRRPGALPAGLQPNGTIKHAEFIDNSTGWLHYSSGACELSKMHCTQQNELLSTVDGGKTFTVITPHPAAAVQTSPGALLPFSRSLLPLLQLETDRQGAANPDLSPGAKTVVSNSSGIDLACAPAATAMQTWWADSPYQDIGVYLGGCDVYCVSPNGQNTCASSWYASTSKTVDSNLTSAWMTGVTKMGWGILPIWVGPQAPCIANASSYWTINNSDSYSTGTYQADLAIAQANALGITNGIIYFDMEGYTPDGGSCSNAVETFLDNWTTELHANGFESGLYGGISDFETDFLALSPEPDVAWIAAWDTNNTIWNIGTLSNSYWPNNQRIHQWNSETSGETWGGVNLGGIDQNVVDAPVVGNWLAISPSIALSNNGSITISAPGSSGMSTISVTPSNGFTGVVTLSCSIAGSASIPPTCSIPATVTITGTTASTATLTINTIAATQAVNLPRSNYFPAGSGSILACLLLLGFPRHGRSWRKLLGVLLLAASIGAIAGCGGGGSTGGGGTGGTTLGTYTVTVIGVDQATGTVKSNTTLTATVN